MNFEKIDFHVQLYLVHPLNQDRMIPVNVVDWMYEEILQMIYFKRSISTIQHSSTYFSSPDLFQ